MPSMADESPLDLRTLIDLLWVRRRVILVWMGIVIAAFVGVAFLSTPIYRSSVEFISSSSGQSGLGGSLFSALDSLGGLASQAGINLSNDGAVTEESLAVLKSRQLTQVFIADRGLMPKLFAKKWDEQNRRWRVSADKQPTPEQAYRWFDEDIRTVVRDKKTGLITLQIDWRDRNEAADWANELVRRVNAEMRSRAIANAEASVGFLQRELNATSDIGTREAINRLIETQVKQRMIANVTPDYAFRVIDGATAPDADDAIRPKKLVLLAMSPVVGFAVGIAFVLMMRALREALKTRPGVEAGH